MPRKQKLVDKHMTARGSRIDNGLIASTYECCYVLFLEIRRLHPMEHVQLGSYILNEDN